MPNVLGSDVLQEGEPSIIALANSWIISNLGGPPTGDKPTVTVDTPRVPDHISGFLKHPHRHSVCPCICRDRPGHRQAAALKQTCPDEAAAAAAPGKLLSQADGDCSPGREATLGWALGKVREVADL
jgi:hypothetical protein